MCDLRHCARKGLSESQNCTAEHMWPTSEEFHHSCDISPQYQHLHCLPAGAAQQAVRQLLLGPLTRFWRAADAIILFPHLKMTSLALRMRKMYRNPLVSSLAHTSVTTLSPPLCSVGREDSGNNQKQEGRLTDREGKSWAQWERRGDNRGK